MGLFSKLFKKKEKLIEPADLSVLQTDFHSHIIPGIDDGAQTIEDSIDLIKGLMELGFKKIITTPHCMVDYYRNTPEIINEGLAKVQAEIKKQNLNVVLEAAAEYYVDDDFERKINAGEILTFGNNYVLFELPFLSEPPNLAQVVFSLQSMGYRPILAHPERYGFYYNDFEKYQDFVDRGVYLQVNLMSLMGHYSPETKKVAEKLIERGLVSFIGSDLHNVRQLELLKLATKFPHLHQLLDSGKLKNAEL
ncbi:tyrosine-protein phosphatase [Acidiluteibacter ferrifornacis]|uniref:protein-tyrosine-phosphatase n=1 Tax=Acidiluteibacter ferrifornacis TaxID=2692424 RepID=A0A6N9NMY1_9FLAO|nr:CpsB/CapC family capsule biosynthesis tyrosine phosphatase [Acidiluteibacter ferrifornacis]MBR9832648.1 capsular biosynthesis protein [bacterium]NBG66570.1 capsular biosynthesis protein [Acidiluteibacter ferrifornacis]